MMPTEVPLKPMSAANNRSIPPEEHESFPSANLPPLDHREQGASTRDIPMNPMPPPQWPGQGSPLRMTPPASTAPMPPMPSFETQVPDREPRVYLRKVVQDAYEYHGLWDLLLFSLFCVLCTLVLFFHWEPTTAVFKNTMQSSFASYGNDDWAQSNLFGKADIYEGYQYMTGYLEFYINRSTDIGFDEPIVRVDDYGDVMFAQLMINLERNCHSHYLPCYKEHPEKKNFLLDRGWKHVPGRQFSNRASMKADSDWLGYMVITTQDRNRTRASFLETLYAAMEDDVQQFIGKYAYSTVCDMFIRNVLSPQDGATFAMHVQRTSTPARKIRTDLVQFTTITPTRTSFYRIRKSVHDRIRLALELVFLVVLWLHIRNEYLHWTICWVQFKEKDKLKFFKYYWNIVQVLSTASLFIWMVYYIILVAVTAVHKPQVPPLTHHDMYNLQWLGTAYSSWLWGYIVVTTVLGLRLVRYMRIHAGLKAFYQVFILAAKEFADFGVFMAYVMLLVGAAVFAFFQLSGGNSQFLLFESGLSVMARLTFNVLDYNEFRNNALGLGTATSAVTVLYWVSILLLVLYSQNIILAIVAHAYDKSKMSIGAPENSFPVLVLQHVMFSTMYWFYWMKHVFWLDDDEYSSNSNMSDAEDGFRVQMPVRRRHKGRSWMLAHVVKTFRGSSRASLIRRQATIGMYGHILANIQPGRGSLMARWRKARWACWALVRNREFLSLVALYQDFVTLKLKRQSKWDVMGILQPQHNVTVGEVVVPDLESYVTESELRGLLHTLNDMHRLYNRTPNPFRHFSEDLIPEITAAIMKVYAWQAQEAEQQVQQKQEEAPLAMDSPRAAVPDVLAQKSGPSYKGVLRVRDIMGTTGSGQLMALGSADTRSMAGAAGGIGSQLSSVQEQLQQQNQLLHQALGLRVSQLLPEQDLPTPPAHTPRGSLLPSPSDSGVLINTWLPVPPPPTLPGYLTSTILQPPPSAVAAAYSGGDVREGIAMQPTPLSGGVARDVLDSVNRHEVLLGSLVGQMQQQQMMLEGIVQMLQQQQQQQKPQ